MITLFIEPFIEFGIFGSFFAVFIWASIFAFVPPRRITRRRVAPFAVATAALLIFVFVPFTELAIKADFYWKLSQRTAAAERIVHSSGSGAAKMGGLGDPVDLAGLSDDDEGFYWHKNEKRMVLFFTFRGILGHFSGFVYSDTDAPPENEDFGCRLVEVERFRPKWYWIACR